MLHGLKQGTAVLKEIHKELNVESVERLLEETAEAREYQRVGFRSASSNTLLKPLVIIISGNRQYAHEQLILGRRGCGSSRAESTTAGICELLP